MTQRTTLSNWLFFSALMVFAMAVIGAITRLTESGLSMVEWRPLIGTLPPLSEAEWTRVFDLYRETPEYQLKNAGMGMEQFKQIFFWEWFHRLWGRLIGLVYALPLLFFWVRGMIPKGWGWPLFGLLILGGMQGVMGWYMVESGLVDRPSVSHFRLAAHLSLAALIFCLLIFAALVMRNNHKPKTNPWIMAGFAAVIPTFVWGAFVAGLDAGMIYNEFPHMGQGRLIPEEFSLSDQPLIWMLINDPVGVQFAHRWMAIATVLALIAVSFKTRFWAIGGMVIVQMGLGIATLLSQVAIPLAALHQAGAFVTLGLLVWGMWCAEASDSKAVRAHDGK